jgi:hypothetical protein
MQAASESSGRELKGGIKEVESCSLRCTRGSNPDEPSSDYLRISERKLFIKSRDKRDIDVIAFAVQQERGRFSN